MSIEQRKTGLRAMIEGNKTVHYGLAPIVVELATDLLACINALENIQSTKKSDLMENPAYWGEMIVGESASALARLGKDSE